MVNKTKLKQAEEMKVLLDEFSAIGVIDMHKMPSRQLQEIRKRIRGNATIRMSKKSTFKVSLKELGDESIMKLSDHIPKQPAFILTDMDPFKLYSLVKALRFRTFAKEGDEANEDIWVYAGPTGLMAGPVISEFQQAGIAAGIEGGKVSVKKDKLVVKKGELIDGARANILRKLKIEPIEITLKVVAVYENGTVYTEDALRMVLMIPDMIPQAYFHALNLAVRLGYVTKDTIGRLLSKASAEAQILRSLIKFEEVNPDVGKEVDVVKGSEEHPRDENESDNTSKEV